MKLRKFLCGALAALMVAAGGGLAMAEGNYREEALPFAESAHEQAGPGALFAHAGGVLEYFDTGSQGMRLQHFRSADAGKTWSQVDATWYRKMKKQFEASVKNPKTGDQFDPAAILNDGQTGRVISLYACGNGDVYCIMNCGAKPVQTKTVSTSYELFKVLRVSGRTASEIPNLTLENSDWETYPGSLYRILEVTDDGDIIIMKTSDNGSSDFITLYTYDRTGKLKSEVPMREREFVVQACANRKLYVLDPNPDGKGQRTLKVYDTTTGKLERTVVNQTPTDRNEAVNSLALAAKKDGTVFITGRDGLFRLKPGSGTYVKLLDRTAFGAGSKTVCWAAACTEEGTVYLTAAVPAGSDQDTDHYKLYRYSPK